ncbi:MAG: DNA-processing protein DprA [Candidatus Harrisonbacteria bacterium]|nr:DNA-processing protein DprA [Candidatus Harrisonbacteria bacterium]
MSEEHIAYHTVLEREPSYKRRESLYAAHQSWLKVCRVLELDIKAKGEQNLLLTSDPAFPPLLKEIPLVPHGMYFQGLLRPSEKAVAIVGTRGATKNGLEMAHGLAKTLAKAGLTIVSGLALGLDGAAHRGALEGGGRTIAVMPCGLKRIYPKEHASLAREIIGRGGALVSEYHPQRGIEKYQFLERNRIVSGLSLMTVVIEAPQRSGALSTASHCIEQNRELGVLPGPVSDPNYQGSNQLIQQGAALISSAQDVFNILGI